MSSLTNKKNKKNFFKLIARVGLYYCVVVVVPINFIYSVCVLLLFCYHSRLAFICNNNIIMAFIRAPKARATAVEPVSHLDTLECAWRAMTMGDKNCSLCPTIL